MKKVNLKFVDHAIGKDLWYNKKDLFNNFMGAFYDFILEHDGQKALQKCNLSSKQEFLDFAGYWNNQSDGCYALGYGFHKFFVTANEDYNIENQPTDTFVGYCYHNDIFKDFLTFLVSFFAYWRNDEGCTRFNPYNKCDNMFVSSWASLVDTGKLFCLDADTVYWWQSFRVKYCLDNIPGVILSEFTDSIAFEGEVVLPKVRVAGYQFLGWVDENDNEVTKVNSDCTVYAKLLRKDQYTYWEKEEKTIVKVIDPNWKRVDPA